MERCQKPMRTGACEMSLGHRGRHSTVTVYCDICGKVRRGRGIQMRQRISPYETEHVGDMCFMCERDIDGSQQAEVDRAMDAYYGRAT